MADTDSKESILQALNLLWLAIPADNRAANLSFVIKIRNALLVSDKKEYESLMIDNEILKSQIESLKADLLALTLEVSEKKKKKANVQ